MAVDLKRIPVCRPEIDEREVTAARRAILSGWITMGPEVEAFEAEFAATVGAGYACAVSSGTAALHLALLAVGVQPGDEVITVSHSFIATANAVRYCGAVPVFVDIDARTFNLGLTSVEAAIGANTRAILCVHQMGMPCDLAALIDIANRHGLPVVEDAACAIGSEIFRAGRWERIGRPHGGIACFSFHPRKVLTTGDGGMVTTSNEDWDRRIKRWRQHGMDVPALDRHISDRVVQESYAALGYNYRMTDIQAAIGRTQLSRLDGIVQRRRELAARYTKQLESLPGVTPPFEPEWARSNWQSYCIRLNDELDQYAVMQRLLNEGIATRRGIMCAHREMAYPPGSWKCGPGGLIQSELAQDHGIILPLFPQLTYDDQDAVADALARACAL